MDDQSHTPADYCRSRYIRRLAILGSSLRGTTRADSDVDLLVEFEPGQEPGLIALSAMELDFSVFFESRKIDLRTPNDLSRHFLLARPGTDVNRRLQDMML